MDADVLIAGAGPTGLMLACELHLAGVRPIVLERLPRPTGLSKALALVGRSTAWTTGACSPAFVPAPPWPYRMPCTSP